MPHQARADEGQMRSTHGTARLGGCAGHGGGILYRCLGGDGPAAQEVPVPARFGCPDGEAPDVECRQEREAKDHVREASNHLSASLSNSHQFLLVVRSRIADEA